nr:EOG090X0KWJ [Polyphemus pediculus]
MKTGEDIKLKPDSEYPEWLWNLRLGDPPALEDMDKESLQYWLLKTNTGQKAKKSVETDAEKLVNYVCGSNIMKTGEDIKLKPDSEYPEWLWNLRLGDPPALEDMDKESLQYWLRLRKLNLQRNVKLLKLKKF